MVNGKKINALRQTAYLVVNPNTVDNFAFVFNCMLACRLNDGYDLKTYLYMRGLGPDVVFGQAQGDLTVGFLLLRYSVVSCSLSSPCLCFISFVYLDLYELGDDTSMS